jgi:hypothetical protein
MAAMDPELFGYNVISSPERFVVSYDIRTLVTAMAVNLEIIDVTDITEIPSFRQELDLGGLTVGYRSYYDPKYAGMKPVKCVFLPGQQPICVMDIGNTVAFPVFNHLGADSQSPELCDCSVLSPEVLQDQEHNCNLFRFLSGLLVFNINDNGNFLFYLSQKLGSISEINRQAHRAMFIASTFGQKSNISSDLNSNASLVEAYDFCKIGMYYYQMTSHFINKYLYTSRRRLLLSPHILVI